VNRVLTVAEGQEGESAEFDVEGHDVKTLEVGGVGEVKTEKHVEYRLVEMYGAHVEARWYHAQDDATVHWHGVPPALRDPVNVQLEELHGGVAVERDQRIFPDAFVKFDNLIV